jgi:hypothetical protein
MATSPYRSTCTIDGNKFDCLSIILSFRTAQDRSGMPQMGSLATSIRAFADFHDTQNVPNSLLQTLFNMSNVVTKDKVKAIKLEFWQDDAHTDAISSFSFNGWISGYQTLNPSQSEAATKSGETGVNHVLVLDLQPQLDTQNYPQISMSN